VSNRVEVIAELAQGFEGRVEQARLLMKAAAAAGADAAKYQLVYADELAAPDYKHYALFRTLEMPDAAWETLAADGAELGVPLHLDIFGARSLALAERLGAAAVKLHPTDLANAGMLAAVAASAAPRVILGVGGAHGGEIDTALGVLARKPVVLLLGYQGYPTPDDTNHIARLRLVAARAARIHANVQVGFADHAAPDTPLRLALAAAAVGAGATVIEKHLTLGRNMALEDHESALNPDEFLEFTRTLRACAQAMGEASAADDFGMSAPEAAYRSTIRRHVVAARPLSRGTVLAAADLVLKRTSATEPLTDLAAVYDRTLARDLPANAPVLLADLS